MDSITLWGWEKKKRTMLRYIKAGDIFCFQYDENTYCFGRIISRLDIGTPSEIFDYTSDVPVISESDIVNAKRMFHPVNLDVYSLFDRKYTDVMGEWRIIGNHENYVPIDADKIGFWFGGFPPRYKIDIFGNQSNISEIEAKDLQDFAVFGDIHIKDLVDEYLGR